MTETSVPLFDYDDVRFTASGGGETVGHYHAADGRVWAEYSGGTVLMGRLVGTVGPDGTIDGAYCQVSSDGTTAAGTLRSTPERLHDGRIRLHEHWRRADGSSGISMIDQIAEPPPTDQP